MINVTKSYLPSYAKYEAYIKEIWESGWLTNNGKYTVELEDKLKAHLNTKHLHLLNNGTIALQIALKTLEPKGEIITTPFSYVATTSSIVWEGFTPIFADIRPDTLCIDADKIESKITNKTRAILATHVFGIPCPLDEIEAIAHKHGIKVIYDAAHAFGVGYKKKSIFEYGDINTLSFHATKLFHTIEGGAVSTNNDELSFKMEYMRRFGHNGPNDFHGIGINGKISEFHSAMGLCIIPHIQEIISRRKKISEDYDNVVLSLGIQRPTIPDGTVYNYAYYPILFKDEAELLKVNAAFEKEDIIGRRYFYPSLNNLNYLDYQSMPISEDISRRVYCLPLYPDLSDNDVIKICSVLRQAL